MKEALELREPTEMYFAQPLETRLCCIIVFQDNLFEWHFTVRGPLESDFDGGIYHGRILLPPEYPMKPPNVVILTPNGRFELNKKICLSISGYHPETWLPSWSIRTALLALIGFMPTAGAGALGSLDYPVAERRKLAKKSLEWKCKECGACMKTALKSLTDDAKKSNEEAKKLAAQLTFKNEEEKKQAIAEAENAAADSRAPSSCADDVSTAQSPQETTDEPAADVVPPPAAPPQSDHQSQEHITVNRPTPTFRQDGDGYVSLFITVPICVVFLSMFSLLLARRFLL
ncbi:ubiquitin--protein ligase [Cooperia oncophora]